MSRPSPADLDALRADITAAAQTATGDIAVSVRFEADPALVVELDADRRFPAASVIKLGVLLAVLMRVDQGRLDPGSAVELDRTKDVGGFGVLRELPSVHRLDLRELLALMIAFSDNTATNACIDLVGLTEVSDLVSNLGLRETCLGRRLMDFDADARGLRNETSARDAARLIELLVLDEVLSRPLRAYAEDLLRRQRIRDRLPSRLDAELLVGNKTGEVPGVRHDTAIIRGRTTAVVAVLTNGFTDYRTRNFNEGGDASDLIATIGGIVGERLR